MKRKLIFLAVLGFSLIVSELARSENRVSITAKINKEKAGLGERIVLTAILQWIPNKDEEIRIIKVKPPQCSLLKLAGSSQTASSGLYGSKVIASQILKYVFRADEKGLGEISPVIVEYAAGEDEQKVIISSDPFEIKVISLKDKFISGLGFIAVMAAGVLAVISGIVLFLKRRKDKQNSAGFAPVEGCCELKAMDKLIDAAKYRLAGDFKKYYLQMHYVLTDYILVKYHIRIRNKSEDEICQLAFKADIPGELLRLLRETAFISEKVRFSGYEVNPNEERRVFTGIEKYLRLLIPKEAEEKIELTEVNNAY